MLELTVSFAVVAFVLLVVFSLLLRLAHSQSIVLPHPDLFDREQRGRLWPIAIYRDENPAWYGLMVSSYWIAWVTALAVFAFSLPESLNALPN